MRHLPFHKDDNQAYCGGYGIQHGQYGGRCGICGDAWGAIPRAHEAPGGIYATGIIGKSYRQVQLPMPCIQYQYLILSIYGFQHYQMFLIITYRDPTFL